MKVFVTGGTGFIGGRLVRRLLTEGHRVVALVRDPGRASDLAQAGAVLAPGTLADRTSLRAGMAGCDGVYHLAAWYKLGARDDREAIAVNRDGTRNALETAAELRIPRIVYTSTLAVFGDTRGRMVDEAQRPVGPWCSIYDRSKWMAQVEVAEPMARAGLPVVIVQPGLVYGPDDPSAAGETLRMFLGGNLPLVPYTTLCWSHVDDTVDGHLRAMERGRPGEAYILAGPPHTLEEAFRLASKISGVPLPGFRPSRGVLRAMIPMVCAFQRLGLPLPGGVNSESIRVAAGATYLGSNAKARRELGFDPRPLETGFAETVRAEMERLGMPAPAGAERTQER